LYSSDDEDEEEESENSFNLMDDESVNDERVNYETYRDN
jgi:hypothetical protein